VPADSVRKPENGAGFGDDRRVGADLERGPQPIDSRRDTNLAGLVQRLLQERRGIPAAVVDLREITHFEWSSPEYPSSM
jgi:hypothetical protein